MIKSVVLIGAGNLATQLALALKGKGIKISQVYSRTIGAARELAQKVDAFPLDDLSLLTPDADLYILSVKDSAILDVAEKMTNLKGRLVVHTAGSIPMDVLAGVFHNYGVFYPLQTFSKSREVDFSALPICIEASDPSTFLKLQLLAQKLSSSVHAINSQERKTLHLAAVFVNNFVNHFYAIGSEILRDKNLDFELLKPLIRETAAKIEKMDPLQAQTGPARRNDQGVIQDQLILLEDRPEFAKIYTFVTQRISQIYQKQDNDLL